MLNSPAPKNGHAKKCDCKDCAENRVNIIIHAWHVNGKAAEINTRKTIFVRSHFRRGPHFRDLPNTRRTLMRELRSLKRKESQRG